jgi:hypothetical protein
MPLDDGKILLFVRNATVKNSDSIVTMYSALSPDLGMTWQSNATPFYPQQIGQYDVLLKLHSGRLLMATCRTNVYPAQVVLGESVDSGKTWFCRRKFTAPRGQPNSMQGYKDMVQGRDGIIHLIGTHGSGTGSGNNPQVSFTEEWLRQGTCLDVSEWGINTAGMIATCPDESLPGTATEKGDLPVAQFICYNAPNPFNPSTVLNYSLASGLSGRFSIIGINGKVLRQFELTKATSHGRLIWDGKDNNGLQVPTGLYLGKLRLSSGQEKNIRMLMVK